MVKKKYPRLDRIQLLGETADKKKLLDQFRINFIDKIHSGRLLYAFTYPGEKRSAELLYTLRICFFEIPANAKLKMQGAFDGILNEREINDCDILCGSYNAVTVPISPTATYSGFSIVFHIHHIRLHYVCFQEGKIVKNICCYTEKPAGGVLLLLAKALDIVIHNVGSDRDAVCRPLIQALVNQLYVEMLSSFDAAENDTSKLARKIKFYLECNFFKIMNCSEICDELEINRSYASQIFSRDFGITMNNYLLNLRIDAARKLLSSSEDLKIADIAQRCGFQDSGYFSRVFRQHTGKTPIEYRKKHIDSL